MEPSDRVQNPPSKRFNPRMHSGGKLSFRRRVQRMDAKGEMPLVLAGESPPPLDKLVPSDFAKVEIEVGPGKGAFLLAATEVAQDTFWIGIEAAASYAEYAAQRLAKQERENGLLLVDNAKVYLADSVPPGGLARVHVYFPDPWPKRRHGKRRFFTDDVPAIVHRALEPDGYLLVATDNPAYGGQICRVMGASPYFARRPDEEERILAAGPGHGFSPTNFERKYIAEGRRIRRYAYQRLEVDPTVALEPNEEGTDFAAGVSW